jgi:arylsulfatase A-like enzyme
MRLALWWVMACDGEPDVDGVRESAPLEDVTAAISPQPAWGDAPLRCEGAGADRRLWLRDGAVWDGEVQTTVEPGDTIPASALVPGQTWSCVAIGEGGEAVATASIRRPSVVVVLADDLGRGDLGLYGGAAPTPALDALGAQGVRFEAAYSAASLCGPSRAGLLTGRQPMRYGFEYNIGDDPSEIWRGLDTREATLADHLRAVGYRTAAIGKWHLGSSAVFHPNERGFERFWGFLNGRRLSVAPGLPGVIEHLVDPDEVTLWPRAPGGYVVEQNGEVVELDDRHLTDRIADEASDFVRRNADLPFFLYVPFQAPHLPLQATPDHLALVPQVEDPAVWAYRAEVAAFDRGVGRILTALDEVGLAEHTLVFVSSDHGCAEPGYTCSNAPFAQGKLSLAEGGVRVPLLFRWPARVAPAVEARMVSLMDIVPTVLVAAGAPPPEVELDGVDLVPHLTGDPAPMHEALYWRNLPYRAIRQGDTKLVDLTAARFRFDLAADPGETLNLSLADPEPDQALLDALDARGLEAYVPPAWVGRPVEIDYFGQTVVALF